MEMLGFRIQEGERERDFAIFTNLCNWRGNKTQKSPFLKNEYATCRKNYQGDSVLVYIVIYLPHKQEVCLLWVLPGQWIC